MIFRLATRDDAKGILDIYVPFIRDTAISFKYEPPDVEKFADGIDSALSMYPYLVAIDKGEVVGFCYASSFRPHAAYSPSVETTVYVKKEYHSRGIGRMLYSELEILLKEQNVSMMNACIAVSDDVNDPYLDRGSIAFHMKMGFELLGRIPDCAIKFGRPYGIVWMCKRLSTPSDENRFIPFSRIPK